MGRRGRIWRWDGLWRLFCRRRIRSNWLWFAWLLFAKRPVGFLWLLFFRRIRGGRRALVLLLQPFLSRKLGSSTVLLFGALLRRKLFSRQVLELSDCPFAQFQPLAD